MRDDSVEPRVAPAGDVSPRDCSLCSFESFDYRPGEDAYRARFDPDVVEPSTAVVGAVSTVADEDPVDVPTLSSAVDPGALDALFADRDGSDPDAHATFVLDGYEVTLHSTGSIVIRPLRTIDGAIPEQA